MQVSRTRATRQVMGTSALLERCDRGAAEISRHGVGTPVFAGMIAASGIGLFVIPMLYVTFQSLREQTRARFQRRTTAPPSVP